MITRVGSGYGARMRSDEFPARLILNVLKGRDIKISMPRDCGHSERDFIQN